MILLISINCSEWGITAILLLSLQPHFKYGLKPYIGAQDRVTTVKHWRGQLHFDPLTPLLSSGNIAIEYFVKRDLLEERVDPISYLWRLPEVKRLLQKQQSEGSWRYPGKRKAIYPVYHYSLIETWKMIRLLVERYGFTKEHPVTGKAVEFIFSCQSEEGDIRGFIGNQYATYYTGAVMALLIKAGYVYDPRIEKGFKWLLSMRQDDGGWTVPILTHKFDGKTMYRLTSRHAEPVEPDRSKPSSHNWTDMVLRAFAAHPKYRRSKDARAAANLLKARFFQPDSYSSYKASSYWVRFLFWWPNLMTALDSLSLMGYSIDDPDVGKAVKWFVDHQEHSGLWKTTYVEGKEELDNEKNREGRLWVTLTICRIFKRFYG